MKIHFFWLPKKPNRPLFAAGFSSLAPMGSFNWLLAWSYLFMGFCTFIAFYAAFDVMADSAAFWAPFLTHYGAPGSFASTAEAAADLAPLFSAS